MHRQAGLASTPFLLARTLHTSEVSKRPNHCVRAPLLCRSSRPALSTAPRPKNMNSFQTTPAPDPEKQYVVTNGELTYFV